MTSSSLTSKLQIDNLPNRLTIFRILLIPVIILCLYIQLPEYTYLKIDHQLLSWIGCWLFVVAALTDFLDGHYARKHNLETLFGSFLDPIADKFLTVSVLIMLLALDRVPVIPVIILVLREIYISALRLLAGHEGLVIPVNYFGKWKTASGLIGIPMLMANTTWHGISFPFIGKIMIYLSTLLSIYSSVTYSWGLIIRIKEKIYAAKPD